MDEGKGGGDGDLDYGLLANSGIIKIGSAIGRGGRPRADEEFKNRDEIAQILKMAEMYRTRADIRNSLRKWYEKIPCMADFLDIPHIGKMTAQEVCDEDNAIIDRKVARAGSLESGFPDEALLILAKSGKTEMDLDVFKSEEVAKYTVKKFEWFVERAGVWEAVDFVKRELVLTRDDATKTAIIDLVRLKAGEILTRLIEEKKGAQAAEAFLRLGTVCPLKREDLFEVKDEELRDPVVQKAFLRALAKIINFGPGMVSYYLAVRDHMSNVGVFSPKEADSSTEVEGAVRNLLMNALKEHEIVYREVLNAVNAAGLASAAYAYSEHRRLIMISRLVKMMRQSPQLYAIVRDRWKAWKILDSGNLENNPEIFIPFSDHFQRCFDKHPFFYNKMKHHWRGFGLMEARDDEIGHAMSANWVSKVEFGEDEFSDRLFKDVEDEKLKEQRLVEIEDAEENNCALRFRLFYDVKKEEFESKYPQYAENLTIPEAKAMSENALPSKK